MQTIEVIQPPLLGAKAEENQGNCYDPGEMNLGGQSQNCPRWDGIE